MHKLLPLLALPLALAACSGGGSSTTKENPTASTRTLAAADVFDRRAVSDFLQEAPREDEAAGKTFLEAIDAYRNDKNLGKAGDLFLQSLRRYPTARGYYELGNVSIDQKDFPAALRAYRMAEAMGYEPLSKLLYNTACAYARLGQPDSALAYVEYAIEAGYTNADNLLKDADLAALRTPDYAYQLRTVYTEALGGASSPEAVLWQSFKREFPQSALPLTLDEASRRRLTEGRLIAFDYEKYVGEMRDEKFSREVGKEFYYYTQVADRPAFTAIVYAVKNSVMSEDLGPVSYVLASYDARGTLIDKMPVAGRDLFEEPLRVCTVQPTLTFEVKDFKTEYAKDPEEAGYVDNKVVSTSLVATKRYRIGETGKFVPERAAIGMR